MSTGPKPTLKHPGGEAAIATPEATPVAQGESSLQVGTTPHENASEIHEPIDLGMSPEAASELGAVVEPHSNPYDLQCVLEAEVGVYSFGFITRTAEDAIVAHRLQAALSHLPFHEASKGNPLQTDPARLAEIVSAGAPGAPKPLPVIRHTEVQGLAKDALVAHRYFDGIVDAMETLTSKATVALLQLSPEGPQSDHDAIHRLDQILTAHANHCSAAVTEGSLRDIEALSSLLGHPVAAPSKEFL